MKLMACTALLLGIGALGCAVDAPPSIVAVSTSALSCAPYDDSYCDPGSYCDVGTQYVSCPSGVTMNAWMTPDCRWCINRYVCGIDSPVCPF